MACIRIRIWIENPLIEIQSRILVHGIQLNQWLNPDAFSPFQNLVPHLRPRSRSRWDPYKDLIGILALLLEFYMRLGQNQVGSGFVLFLRVSSGIFSSRRSDLDPVFLKARIRIRI